MPKPAIYLSQIDLPIAAGHAKSPIRKQEFDRHRNAELHIQNDGLPGQMLVMTAFGPRMMTPKLQCQCDDSRYGCDCHIVFDDTPPPTSDVIIRCLRTGISIVPNESNFPNCHTWTLNYTFHYEFFRLVPVKVYDLPLDQLIWHAPDLPPECCVAHVFGGANCIDIYPPVELSADINITARNSDGTVGIPIQDTLLKFRNRPIP